MSIGVEYWHWSRAEYVFGSSSEDILLFSFCDALSLFIYVKSSWAYKGTIDIVILPTRCKSSVVGFREVMNPEGKIPELFHLI